MSTIADAVVVGGCLSSFTPQVSAQDRQDIQDCLLYAELAANDKYPGLVSKKVWFDYYQGRLIKAGFKLKAFVASEPVRVANIQELLAMSHTVIGRMGYPRLGQLLRDTYKTLTLDRFAWEFFQGNVARGGQGILKCSPCERLASGETVVCLLSVQYSSRVTEQAFFLWSEFHEDLQIVPGGGVFAFDPEVFQRYRERVHEKIESYSAKSLVHELKL
ncbi:hypothetical protein [Pseudomonas fluorescens]|uniref:hypothetical protein n=1 Tax=Pseudomonas fluorescens TaxID=294 RepID=UPI001913409E|nr:hypothetical protein [Pseudomonas fluorescens]